MRIVLMCSLVVVLPLPGFSLRAQQGGSGVTDDLHDAVALDPHALAVLPIEVLTDDPKAPTVAAEAFEAIMLELGSVHGLYVIPQELVVPYVDAALGAREIGQQLAVRYVLETRIEGHPYALTLQADLRDTVTGRASGAGHPVYVSPDIQIVDPPFDLSTLVPDAGTKTAELVRATLFPETQPDPELVLVEQTQRFLDTALTDRERYQALRELTSALRNQPSETVIVAAVELAMHSDDPGVRSAVWGLLAVIDDPWLIQHLLHALRSESDAGPRSIVAQALINFADEPEVRDALTYARDSDSSEAIRRGLRLALMPDVERREVLRATAMDNSQTDSERSFALARLSLEDVSPALDPELVLAMVGLARSARYAQTRQHVWLTIGRSSDPRLVQPLLEPLNEDPDESVREAVVTGLGQFRDIPDVSLALKEAMTSDSSPLVRKRAGEALSSVDR